MAINPYTFMILKFQPHRVYGWSKQIISILQVATASEPVSYAIYGIRAIGKSTLLKYLKHPQGATKHYNHILDDEYRSKRKRLVWVYINCHQLYEDSNIIHMLFTHLLDTLCEEKLAQQLAIEVPPIQTDKRTIAAQLRETLTELEDKEKLRVVFLLDDFDIPLLSDQIDIDDDHLLRTISDAASLIIATDEPISKLRADINKTSPLLGILRPERIGLIDEKAAQRLIYEPAAKSKEAPVTLAKEEVDLLLEVGGRIPYLLTMTCEKYFEMRETIIDIEVTYSTPTLQQNMRSQLIDSLLLEPGITNVLTLIWNKHADLHPTLVDMATAEREVFTGPEAKRVEGYSLAYQTQDTTGKIGSRIFSALFAEFVRREANVSGALNGHVDANLTSLLSNLSPIDRGVLEYLASREGQVCTFEELLDTVWEDGTGTKRALEAAVHRLRRTVPSEHDIRNIRGAGYKYVITEKTQV